MTGDTQAQPNLSDLVYNDDGTAGKVGKLDAHVVQGFTASRDGEAPLACLYIDGKKGPVLEHIGQFVGSGYPNAKSFFLNIEEYFKLGPRAISVHFDDSGDLLKGGQQRLLALDVERPLTAENMSMTEASREETDAKLAASEARNDVKFAKIEGKLDLIVSEMKNVNDLMKTVREDVRSVRANSWVIAFGLAALMVAIAFGLPTIAGFGASIRDMVHNELQSQKGQ